MICNVTEKDAAKVGRCNFCSGMPNGKVWEIRSKHTFPKFMVNVCQSCLEEIIQQAQQEATAPESLRHAIVCLRNEVNCRIEHGAASGGHLEAMQTRLDTILEEHQA